jgi:Flp pilus assembly protein TadD
MDAGPDSALLELSRAAAIEPGPEVDNNLGVACWRAGQLDRARDHFSSALRQFPGYRDAAVNLTASQPASITSHPLRRHAWRSEYAAA